jgi:predicted enzyme related to lactoylglutathione lyase
MLEGGRRQAEEGGRTAGGLRGGPLTPMPQCGMAIIGAHALVYTSEPEAVRAIFRDVFGWKFVDDGQGWLIFALPPAELGVHPAEGPTYEGGTRHQLTFMCDDIATTVEELRGKGIEVRGDPEDEGWGITTTLVLPGDLEVMLYEPRHQTAI